MDFHALFERYAPHVRRFALFLCGDHALADDITSETFIRAWVTQNKIMQDSVKAYLFTIARNLYRDALRGSKRSAPLGDVSADLRPSVQHEMEMKSELHVVMEAIQKLPEADRAALLMRAQDGMSYEEISQVLGLAVTNVKVKIHRARLKLLQLREPQGKNEDAGEEA